MFSLIKNVTIIGVCFYMVSLFFPFLPDGTKAASIVFICGFFFNNILE
jgi:hypothetical protein